MSSSSVTGGVSPDTLSGGGGAGGRVTVAPLAAVAALGLAVIGAEAGILDFESLPEPTTPSGNPVSMYVDPLAFHMGFKFSSEGFYSPSSGDPFANVWSYYTLGPNPSTYSPGYPYGINGERALGTPMDSNSYLGSWKIERDDGGEWMFGGAQFTAVHNNPAGQPFRIVGWRDGVEVYDITTELVVTSQTFVGAQVGSVAVDHIVLTYRHLWPSGALTSRWFTTDDLHYELVPAPGALVLLSMRGLMRHRRRD